MKTQILEAEGKYEEAKLDRNTRKVIQVDRLLTVRERETRQEKSQQR